MRSVDRSGSVKSSGRSVNSSGRGRNGKKGRKGRKGEKGQDREGGGRVVEEGVRGEGNGDEGDRPIGTGSGRSGPGKENISEAHADKAAGAGTDCDDARGMGDGGESVLDMFLPDLHELSVPQVRW